MADGIVNKVTSRLTGVDHESISELHRLCTSSTELARYNHFTPLGVGFHNKTEDTIAGTADGEATKELVSQTFTLGDGRETTVLNFLGVQFERVLWEFETLLDEGSKFTNAAAFLSKDFLSMGSTNDDFGAGVCYTDITSRVTFFGEFTSEEFIEFGAEDTVCDELALFADLGGHLEDYITA
jgi:hypothetical protein